MLYAQFDDYGDDVRFLLWQKGTRMENNIKWIRFSFPSHLKNMVKKCVKMKHLYYKIYNIRLCDN